MRYTSPGMFAFAIWDGHRARLYCARDRFGIKPFYYTAIGTASFFASEIKSILQSPECPRQVDDGAAVAFLAHNHCDDAERTTFRGIRALPAGHVLTVEATGRQSLRRYWKPDVRPPDAQSDAQRIAGV